MIVIPAILKKKQFWPGYLNKILCWTKKNKKQPFLDNPSKSFLKDLTAWYLNEIYIYTCTEFIDWWTSERAAKVIACLSFQGVLGELTIIKSEIFILNYDLLPISKAL